MTLSLLSLHDPELAPFLEKLERLFIKIDAAYDDAARQHGFVCNGCDENCCETLFFHHTFLEVFYLAKGLQTLDAETRKEVFEHAEQYFSAQLNASADKHFRRMCPLNRAGRCQLYAHRPMICRLHGIPYTLSQQEGPGCDDFYQRTVKIVPLLDRTQIYRELAFLEKALREQLNERSKIRLTIAEIIMALKVEFKDENP